MRAKTRALLNKLQYLGVESKQPYETSKRIVFTNQIALVFFAGVTPFIFLLPIMGYPILGLGVLGIALTNLSCLWLNHRHHYAISRTLLIFSYILPAIFYACVMGPRSSIRYIFFPLFVISYGLFESFSNTLRYFTMACCIGAFFFLEFSQLGRRIEMPLPDLLLTIAATMTILNVFVILFLSFQFYYQVIRHKNQELGHSKKFHQLSDREKEVIACIIKGDSNQEIARKLFIEENTVKNHLKNIYRKLEIKNRVSLLNAVLDMPWVTGELKNE